jgi:hypothetical protein
MPLIRRYRAVPVFHASKRLEGARFVWLQDRVADERTVISVAGRSGVAAGATRLETASGGGCVRRADQLRNDVEELERLLLEQQAAIESHQLEIERLRLILARLRCARFGRSSEALDPQIERLELTLEDLEAAQAATQTRIVSPERRLLPKNRCVVSYPSICRASR